MNHDLRMRKYNFLQKSTGGTGTKERGIGTRVKVVPVRSGTGRAKTVLPIERVNFFILIKCYRQSQKGGTGSDLEI